jgi:hypothetical protein
VRRSSAAGTSRSHTAATGVRVCAHCTRRSSPSSASTGLVCRTPKKAEPQSCT